LDVFEDELEYISSDPGKEIRKLKIGFNTKDNYELSATVIYPREYKLESDEAQIYEACYLDLIRKTKMEREDIEYSPENYRVKKPKNIGNICIVSEGEPVFIAIRIEYSPDQDTWSVFHPFGKFPSKKIKSLLENILFQEENNLLKKQIFELVEIENSRYTNLNDLENKLKYLENKYGPKVLKFKQLCEYIVKFDQIYQKDQKNENDNNDLISYGYKIIAEILFILKTKYNEYYSIKIVSERSIENLKLFKRIARYKCGFQFNDDGLMDNLLRVKKGEIINCDTSMSIKSLFAVNLLIALNVVNHPFYKLADEIPNYIKLLANLLKIRRHVEHDSKTQLDQIEIKNQIVFVKSNLLFFLREQDSKEKEFINDDNYLENESKLYKISKNNLIVEFGSAINQNNFSVYDYLLEIERNYILLKETTYVTRIQDLSEKIVVNISKVIENILNNIAKDLSFDYKGDLIENDKLKNYAFIRSVCTKYKFICSETPEVGRLIEPNKLRDSIRNFSLATINSKIYALLFAVYDGENTKIKTFAYKIPKFIEFCFSISEKRCHGIGINISTEEIEKIKNELYGMIKKIMNYIRE